MNNTVYYDPTFSDDERRQRLFDGQLMVYSPRASTLAFIEFARTMIEDAFAPHDPELAQYQMPVEQYAKILGELKPGFIHHPESKRHLQNVLHDLGCDLAKTYFDVPKMRSSTSDNYLTTGIAYAWTLTGTPGILRRSVRSIGGSRSMIFDQTMRWRSIRSTGIALSRIVRRGTTTICGISRTAEHMSHNF